MFRRISITSVVLCAHFSVGRTEVPCFLCKLTDVLFKKNMVFVFEDCLGENNEEVIPWKARIFHLDT